MMRKKIIFTFIVALSLGLTACMSPGQKYARDYGSFAEDFLNNYPTYTATDWDAALQTYEYMRQQYAYYMSDFTQEERQAIDEINCQINAVFIKHETEDAVNRFDSFLNEAAGTLNELLK